MPDNIVSTSKVNFAANSASTVEKEKTLNNLIKFNEWFNKIGKPLVALLLLTYVIVISIYAYQNNKLKKIENDITFNKQEIESLSDVNNKHLKIIKQIDNAKILEAQNANITQTIQDITNGISSQSRLNNISSENKKFTVSISFANVIDFGSFISLLRDNNLIDSVYLKSGKYLINEEFYTSELIINIK